MKYTKKQLIAYLADLSGYTEILLIADKSEEELTIEDLEDQVFDWDDVEEFFKG